MRERPFHSFAFGKLSVCNRLSLALTISSPCLLYFACFVFLILVLFSSYYLLLNGHGLSVSIENGEFFRGKLLLLTCCASVIHVLCTSCTSTIHFAPALAARNSSAVKDQPLPSSISQPHCLTRFHNF